MIVDLFAGPGGLDVAAHWIGVPAIGIEFDESAVDTREAAGLSSILADVTRWQPDDFTETINVLTGGPPCQTFTVAGNGHGRRALDQVVALVQMLGAGRMDEVLQWLEQRTADPEFDPRTGLVLQPLIWALKALDAGRPYEAIMLEQVPAVKPVWEAMQAVLESKGYGVDVDVLCTEEFGVPQTRRRAVLAARWGMASKKVQFPDPTHQKYVRTAHSHGSRSESSVDRARWTSMGEALGWDMPFTVRSNYGKGGNPRDRGERGHDHPAFTVTGKIFRNRILFGDGQTERRFYAEEAGRLQTFPWDYPWDGRDVAQQIGNAVPPRLGVHLLSWLLGIDVELSEAFFAARADYWVSPDLERQLRIKDSVVVRGGVRWDTPTKAVGAPERVGSSKGGEVMGVVGGGSTIDAVEPEPGHRPGVEAAVGAAS